MRPAPIFAGYVDEDGSIIPDDPKRYSLYLLGLKGQRVQVKVQKERRGRTLSQNSFLWAGVYDEIVAQVFHDRTDITSEDIHAWCRDKWCPTVTKDLIGGETVSRRSTTLLSVEQMSEYVEKVMAHWASEYGVEFHDR